MISCFVVCFGRIVWALSVFLHRLIVPAIWHLTNRDLCGWRCCWLLHSNNFMYEFIHLFIAAPMCNNNVALILLTVALSSCILQRQISHFCSNGMYHARWSNNSALNKLRFFRIQSELRQHSQFFSSALKSFKGYCNSMNFIESKITPGRCGRLCWPTGQPNNPKS